MKRITLLASLLVLAFFIMPTYAGKPTPEPNQVEVVNGPENPVPVAVTNPPQTGISVIKGIDRQQVEVTGPAVGTKYDLVSLAGPGTFIGAQAKATTDGSQPADTFFVQLEIDGKMIVDLYVEDLGSAYDQTNPMGITRLSLGTTQGIFVGFIQPVAFQSSLTLSVTTLGSMVRIDGTVLHAE